MISLKALAPRSNGSGSKPADVVLGLSFRTFGGASAFPAAAAVADGAGEGGTGTLGEDEEKGEKVKGASAWETEAEAAMAVMSPIA